MNSVAWSKRLPCLRVSRLCRIFHCIIAAPDGLKKLHEVHPDMQVYVGYLDRCLNEDAYICPGLGDAGDRIFGTK